MMRPSKAGRRWSLLAGFVAGEAYSIYATFFAHALAPATAYVVDRYTHQRLLPGQIGDIEEIFDWDGLLPILVVSLIVFSLPWCIMRVTAGCFVTSSVLNVIELRDITLARTEPEVGCEIVLRLPVAERNVSDFKEAVEQEGCL
jgi:hypothetical protein